MQESAIRLTFEENPLPSDVAILSDALSASNVAAVGVDNYQPLAVFLRDESDNVVGGLSGATYWAVFHLELLWIREDLRGQGFGDHLLALAEREAVTRGCRRAYLSTFSFQALAFYATRGYEVFGTLPDFPPGHAKHYMAKTLTGSPPTSAV